MQKEKMIDYASLTETAGQQASQEQLERIVQRYAFARSLSEGKNVLEVACGSGIGIPYLSMKANSVTANDIDEKNVIQSSKVIVDSGNSEKASVSLMDAHKLEYKENSFDIVLLFEAVYYLENPMKFFTEASRVLKPGGIMLIGSVNSEWSDFHPSPYTHFYLKIGDYKSQLEGLFSEIEFYGGFPIETSGLKSKVFSLIKKVAIKLHLIPNTLKGRERLKRMFIGKLHPMPEFIDENTASYIPPFKIEANMKTDSCKIIYVVAKKI